MIWRHVLEEFDGQWWTGLRFVEEITQLNRQLRSETHSIVYENTFAEFLHGETSADWVKSVQQLIDDYSPRSCSPDFSLLHHLSRLKLDIAAGHPSRGLVRFCFFLMNDREDMMSCSEAEAEEEECVRVVVGSPGMDWTDAKAVRAACDKAVTELESSRKRRIEEAEEELLETEELWGDPLELRAILDDPSTHSYAVHYRAALDAMCALISACPRLKNAAILEFRDDL